MKRYHNNCICKIYNTYNVSLVILGKRSHQKELKFQCIMFMIELKRYLSLVILQSRTHHSIDPLRMPYDPKSYRHTTSGIYIFALVIIYESNIVHQFLVIYTARTHAFARTHIHIHIVLIKTHNLRSLHNVE